MKLLSFFRDEFDKAFTRYIDGKIDKARLLHPDAGRLAQHIKRFVAQGGKRFRPALFYYAYGSKQKGIDPVTFSFVFELFHTFALIHDDIIDNASLRRGFATISKQYGTGEAVLAGDLALTFADEIFMDNLTSSLIPDSRKEKMLDLYNRYKQELLAGQYLDYIHIPDADTIMLLKTALYSFVRPAKFGFIMSGNAPDNQELWDVMLEKLGVLFQMKDDYEGVFGREEEIGKSTLSDVAEGKHTVIIDLFKKSASGKELKRFISFFGNKNVTMEEFSWFKENLLHKNIDKTVRGKVEDESVRIRNLITETGGNKTELRELLDELIFHIEKFS